MRSGVSRATINALENGSIKEIGVNRLNEIVRTIDGIQAMTRASTPLPQTSRKSEILKLSFPYDWSNPSIRDDVLIDLVIERGIFEDITRICAAYGVNRVERRMQSFANKNPIAGRALHRMFNNINEAARLAQT